MMTSTRLSLPAAVAVAIAVVTGWSRPAAAQSEAQVALGRRIADIVDIAVSEYSDGVMDGRVVQLEELNEARLFLDGARRSAERLPSDLSHRLIPSLDSIARLIEALAPATELRAEVTAVRAMLEEALGVPLDPMPDSPPAVTRGAALFVRNCAQCHGVAGAGDGRLAPGMDPPPANLADRERLRGVAPVEFFRKINVGVAGTEMEGFAEKLRLRDRWSLALYASTLRHSKESRERGALLLDELCSECLLDVSDFEITATLSDDSLGRLLVDRLDSVPSSEDLMAMSAYARVSGASDELGNDRVLMARRTVRRTKDGVDRAVALASAGDITGAAEAALDAYLIFERIESGVRAKAPAAARRVERAFAELRGALRRHDYAEVLAAKQVEVAMALDEAVAKITTTASPAVLVTQSFVIILREGLEAILIVGALMAFLTQAGAPERRREIGRGVGAAVVASLITAIGFATLFRNATAHQEMLEGITMLLAAGVLFWVSYWLVSKIEMRKWRAFVRSRMEGALTSRRAWALAGVAFLAVYREGFETVLFYAALYTSSDGSLSATMSIGTGIAAGGFTLGIVYYLMQRFGVRLPLKPFFAVTSALLYIMAFSFAGQGVAELQEIGWIPTTTLGWLPAVPALGIFPTIQTLFSQLLLALALLGALAWVFWLEPWKSRVTI